MAIYYANGLDPVPFFAPTAVGEIVAITARLAIDLGHLPYIRNHLCVSGSHMNLTLPMVFFARSKVRI